MPTKVPYGPTTHLRANTTDQTTWATFELAQQAWHNSDGRYEGVGFVFALGDPYCGVDLDNCLDEEGNIRRWARPIIDTFDTYAEVSPSGRGIKMFMKASKPGNRCKRGMLGEDNTGAIEIYDHDRYFTVTGKHLRGTPTNIEDRQQQLAVVYEEHFGHMAVPAHKNPTSTTLDTDDDELLRRMFTASNGPQIKELWDGDISSYPSPSEADLALCNHVAFWCGPCPDRIDQLYRRSTLMRPKWDQKRGDRTYGQMTVAKALEDRVDYYSPTTSCRSPSDRTSPEAAFSDKLFAATDLGNAERLVDRFGPDLRYCHQIGRWLVWNGQRWAADSSGKVMRMAAETARAIYSEAGATPNETLRKQLADWAKSSEACYKLDSMVKVARSNHGVAVTTEQLDADQWLLNVLNGTINLCSGELRPHHRDDLITKIAPVQFDPEAKAPLWQSFIERIFDGDNELIQYVQRVQGMCLTGDIREQYLFVYHGEGGNGKSVLLDSICGLMGDYASEAPPALLTVSKFREHPTEIADLLGRRLVVASETEEGSQLNLQMVKRLTGNARQKARFMRRDYFEFDRTHKLVLVTNNKPAVNEDTEGAWRRIRLVPFNVVIPPKERDNQLIEKLRAEWPGILAWMVRGCLDWQREGLNEPRVVLMATESYRQQSDQLQLFVAENCDLGAGLWVSSTRLSTEYEAWCRERGEQRLHAGGGFGKRLRKLGCVGHKMKGDRGWLGIALRR